MIAEFKLSPIGIIHTPFKNKSGMPIQPKSGVGIKGRIELFEKYVAGLKDLDFFRHFMIQVGFVDNYQRFNAEMSGQL